MDNSYILISNNENDVSNIEETYIHKTLIILDFKNIIKDVRKSFKDEKNIIEQFIIDCKRSNIIINKHIQDYKKLNKYIRKNINLEYYYEYLICFTQALLSVPYIILSNSTKKYVGELSCKERKKFGSYNNIVISNNKAKIYKMLRIFNITENGDKTLYYIKISMKFGFDVPDDIVMTFKIINIKN